MRTRRTRRNQKGSILILTLVFLALFGTVVGLMLSFGQVGIKLHNAEATKSHSIYAADGAIQYGIAQAKANSGVCPSNMTGAGLPLAGTIALPKDVSNVNITCQQYTGAGTNTFGGYAVVAGVNVNSSGTYVVNNCSPAQTSISSDPVGSGAPTFAEGTRSCQKYPGGGTPPSWTSNVTPNPANPGTDDTTAAVNGDFVLTPIEQWFVGTHVVSGSTVPFVWFAPDSDDYSDATGAGGTPLPATFAPTKVWAAGFNAVFVIGTQSGAGAIYFSNDSENAATPGGVVHWSNMAIPNAKTLTDVYGLPGDAGNVWAVGTTTAAGNPGGVWYFNGATWTLAATLKSSTAANGVWAADATHVWVAGTSGGAGAIWTNTNWATVVTAVGGTISLADVRGVDATHVWAVGVSTGTARGAIATSNGATWPNAAIFTGTSGFKAFVPLSTTDLWVVGASGGTSAQIWCNNNNTVGGTCGAVNNTWQAQVLPVTIPALPALNDASGVKVGSGATATYVITAVGTGGTVLSYAPLAAAGNCNPCLARVQGSVFNANTTNLPSGLCLSLSIAANCRTAPYTGSFTQYQTSGCVAPPANLAPSSPAVPYSCTPTLPPFAAKPLPTTKPAVAANQAGTSVAPSGACTTGYTYFTPGTYNQAINFSPHRTYFFESGVYVIEGNSSATGGFGAFDNLTNPPAANDLWVIGGKPSPGDVPAFAQNSPCWAAIQANSAVWNGGSGTGIELIMAKSTWLDVHTVNLELFTREGGNVATEGPQGISVRDVSGVTAASSPWGSDLNNRPAPNMVLQVDANSPLHYPNVYVHGSIFLPNENVEEYTNPQATLSGPVLGAIFANSIEFTYASSNQPPLIVSSGSAGAPTAVFTATTGSVRIQAFVPFDATTTPATPQLDPAKGYSYRVLSPS